MTSGADLRVALVEALDLYDLRRRVLRNNDPAVVVANARDEDAATRHFAGFVEGELLVSASFFADADRSGCYQLRYMATDPRVQGRGYGAGVLEAAERQLASEGVTRLWANARDSALGFYRRLGWRVIEGSEHISAETQIPHTVIEKDLELRR